MQNYDINYNVEKQPSDTMQKIQNTADAPRNIYPGASSSSDVTKQQQPVMRKPATVMTTDNVRLKTQKNLETLKNLLGGNI